ncbi:TIGR03086 family metal-binding protein [Ruania alba]|uniref:TIGR03086 family protein n=1 Tax=Ruania alba TaxID=648782 RepID=A0A1H5KIJ4_9MICO|nr:TIGR03086 family metal-binding protein [Ruania alba]SEE64227.1 TIGR03086 family protein [Ruania alba]
MFDLTATTARTAGLATHVQDDQLADPTPMDAPVEQLVQHLLGLSVAFRDAAAKIDGPTTNTPPQPVTEPLPPGWRELLAERLTELAEAWQEPAAWEGMTRAGGVELPGEVCGLIALDEVLLHGWDLAVATGQAYQPGTDELEAIVPIVTPNPDPEQAAAEREGMFGAPVAVAADAPLLDRVLGMAGRDPAWRSGH